MVPLDRALKPELLKICKDDVQLSEEIERKKVELNLDKQLLTARRVLFMIYGNLSSDKSMLEISTIRTLTDLKWEQFGSAAGAHKYWHRFLTVLARLDNPLTMEHQRDTLYSEMRKSEGLKIPLLKYEETDTCNRTFDQLKTIMTKWVAIQAIIAVVDLITSYFFYYDINTVFCFNKLGK